MFGQGLDDQDTLPFLINVASGSHYRTYNFGVMGYGAHQMLSAIQHDLVKDVVECDPQHVTHVIYQGITDHVRRSAGPTSWSPRGPRYVLDGHGRVELDGRYENMTVPKKDTWWQLITKQVRKSQIYQASYGQRHARKYEMNDIELYVGILQRAQEMVRDDYPMSEFHVLWWDEDNPDNRLVIDGLRKRGIDIRLMSEILPNYDVEDINLVYRLHERDLHPNALANELIARYTLREILPRRLSGN
jgi:hypothetical protein